MKNGYDAVATRRDWSSPLAGVLVAVLLIVVGLALSAFTGVWDYAGICGGVAFGLLAGAAWRRRQRRGSQEPVSPR